MNAKKSSPAVFVNDETRIAMDYIEESWASGRAGNEIEMIQQAHLQQRPHTTPKPSEDMTMIPIPLNTPSLPSRSFHSIEAKNRLLSRKLEAKVGIDGLLFSADGSLATRRTRTGQLLFRLFGWCLPARFRKQEFQTIATKADIQYGDMTDSQKRNLREFLLDIGYALSVYGVPAHRLEFHLSLISTFFGLEGSFFSTPTGLFASFGDKPNNRADHNVQFVRINSTTFDLYKLCLLDDIADDVSRGLITIDEANVRIDAVLQSRNSNPLMDMISGLLCCGCFAIFFGANLPEIVAAFIAGFVVGLISLLSGKWEIIGRFNNLLSALASWLVGLGFRAIILAINSNMEYKIDEVCVGILYG